ncbi:MAG: hypothetical protein U0169_22430 [Polyangiaceae bacterium]
MGFTAFSSRLSSHRALALSLFAALATSTVACADGEEIDPATVDRATPGAGTTPATVTTPGATAATGNDSSANATAPVIEKPGAGDLVITEVMANPKAGAYAQWFEVFNTASRPRMLNGLTLKDGRYTVTARDCYGNETRSDNVYTIQDTNPIIVGAKSYAVLVRDRNTATYTANVPANAVIYDYPTLDFWSAYPSAGIYIYDGSYLLAGINTGKFINNGFNKKGASIQLKQLGLPANDAASYCQSWRPWSPNSDFGSPGKESDCL